MSHETASTPEQLLGPLNDVERLHAPPRLYVAGDAELLRRHPRVAVVGSRRATAAGLECARALARYLVGRGAVVVSGLAEGIDTAAHTTAMEAGGSTIAVIGTPLTAAYPPKNRTLQAKIAAEHLVVSQFPPGNPIQKGNFPRRNRTMALIADASIIVEAGESSGSLSQGFEALRLGRQLFIMRAVLDLPGLNWPADMLRYGAHILEVPADIVDVPLPTDAVLAEIAL